MFKVFAAGIAKELEKFHAALGHEKDKDGEAIDFIMLDAQMARKCSAEIGAIRASIREGKGFTSQIAKQPIDKSKVM